MTRSRDHDETVIAMIRNDPEFAAEYLRIAFEELDEEGGEAAFISALRHVVEARGGIEAIAKKTGISHETLRRSLSPDGNPTLKTMRQVVHATGLTFAAIA